MKRRIKGLLLVMCMLAVTISFTSYSSIKTEAADAQTSLTDDQILSYKQTAEQLIQQVVSFTDEEMEQYLSMDDPFTTAVLTSWQSVKEDVGEFKEILGQDVYEEGESAFVTTAAQFENETVTVLLELDAASLIDMQFNVDYSLGDLMKQAGMNTLIGIGVVFAILVFLSFLISLFKYINKLENKAASKQKNEPAEVSEDIRPAVSEDTELLGDEELTAVIAAAIAASENTSTDGFVVRSIRKSNRILRRV